MNGFLFGCTLSFAIGIGLGMILLATMQAFKKRDEHIDELNRHYERANARNDCGVWLLNLPNKD